MAKYIPQYLFDGLAVKYMITERANTPQVFDKLIDEYAQKYPDENIAALRADVAAAAREARNVVDALMTARLYPDEGEAVDGLMDVLEKAASLQKPMWRRMVENVLFAVQPTPIVDRVTRSREHLRAAQKVLRDRVAPAR